MASITQTNPGLLLTLTVGSAAINQGRFVTFGSGNLAQTAAGGVPIGVSATFPDLTEDYAATDNCTVYGNGIVKLEASAAIAKGARIKSAAAGKGVTAGSTETSFAIALEAASDDGDYINVLLTGAENPLVPSDIAFTDLSDTPDTITASQTVVGNSGGTALEFSA